MSGKSENIIELKHISKVYSDNGFKAVDDFNLEVKREIRNIFRTIRMWKDNHTKNDSRIRTSDRRTDTS